MKAEDFHKDHKGGKVIAQPEMQADMDIMAVCHKTMDEARENAYLRMRSVAALHHGDEIVNIFGHVGIMPGDGPFNGVVCCIDCLKQAAMHARDCANALDDLVALVEKHAKPWTPPK